MNSTRQLGRNVRSAFGAGILLPLFIAAASAEDAGGKQHSLDEFAQGKEGLSWRVVDDGVMGGLSKGQMSLSKDGSAIFKGTLSLENNGGFSSIRTARMKPLDLSGFEGVAVRVKGDGRTYQFRLESDARFRGNWAVSFKADFPTKKGEWTEVRIPFASFKGSWRGRSLPAEKLNTATIERLGLILADKNPGTFQLEVDWIRPYRNEASARK